MVAKVVIKVVINMQEVKNLITLVVVALAMLVIMDTFIMVITLVILITLVIKY